MQDIDPAPNIREGTPTLQYGKGGGGAVLVYESPPPTSRKRPSLYTWVNATYPARLPRSVNRIRFRGTLVLAIALLTYFAIRLHRYFIMRHSAWYGVSYYPTDEAGLAAFHWAVLCFLIALTLSPLRRGFQIFILAAKLVLMAYAEYYFEQLLR